MVGFFYPKAQELVNFQDYFQSTSSPFGKFLVQTILLYVYGQTQYVYRLVGLCSSNYCQTLSNTSQLNMQAKMLEAHRYYF